MWISRQRLRAPVLGYSWVRALPLLGAISTLTLLHIPEVHPSGMDWLVALSSGLCLLAGCRAPRTVLLAQCALLAASTLGAPLGGTVAQILASVALGELAFRRPGYPTWVGAGALALASAAHAYPLYSVLANVLMVAFNVGLPLVFGSFVRAQRELARQAELRAEEAERQRSWAVDAALTAERASIARELHDVVAHHVAAIVLRAGVARHVAPGGDPRLLEALSDVHSIGGQALADLRKLVAVLRDPGAAEDPALLAATDLAPTLSEVLDRTRQAGVRVCADLDDQVLGELDTVHRHAVWRVVQEGLTNVLKHSGPGTTAQVRIVRDTTGAVLVEVTDDGGSRVASSSNGPNPGHGLVVTRERVQLLDGSLVAGPDAGGWTLRATLPGVTRDAHKVAG